MKEGSKMKKDNFEQVKFETGKEFINILITTEEHIVKGKLYLPVPTTVKNPTIENLLFFVLNCGNMFITLQDCVIMNKKNIEYQPEKVKYYNINLNIVHSCQIVED